MFFLVYDLWKVDEGEPITHNLENVRVAIQKTKPKIRFGVIVEADSHEEAAEKLGADYRVKENQLFFESNLFKESGTGLSRFIYQKGEFTLTGDDFAIYRGEGVTLEIARIKKI
ncbi:MAG: hypothetical protein HYT20_01980 [Candidatus Nealsonbacteria bacterium]|nr:hypothetical protein [Candidatus Nealsonbacteria bacterium]